MAELSSSRGLTYLPSKAGKSRKLADYDVFLFPKQTLIRVFHIWAPGLFRTLFESFLSRFFAVFFWENDRKRVKKRSSVKPLRPEWSVSAVQRS